METYCRMPEDEIIHGAKLMAFELVSDLQDEEVSQCVFSFTSWNTALLNMNTKS
jgi:hypothetical protein